MSVEQALFAIGHANQDTIPVVGLTAAKAHWSVFYPELDRIMDKFIADDTSLSNEQESILYFGILLATEIGYTPAFEKCLQVFSRNDSFFTPIEDVFGDALTELTPSIFYILANGNTQALSDYVMAEHDAMYCKSSAMDAIFAQYEAGDIQSSVLSEYIALWFTEFLSKPNSINRFLISALANACIDYQFNQFKDEFISLCDKSIYDQDRITIVEVKAWSPQSSRKLIESGLVQTKFNVVETLTSWLDNNT